MSGFKDWLSGLNSLETPMCLVYKLATPITESIDPDAIPALSGTNNVYTNAGGETIVIGRIGAKGMMDKLMTMQQQITALQALNDAG